jgi:LacI family transcriptional regulator
LCAGAGRGILYALANLPDKTHKKIALLVDTRLVWGRDVYSGVARYAREHAHWSILHQAGSPDRPPYWLGEERFDGLIGRLKTDEVVEKVEALSCPVVNLYTALAGHPYPVVQFDDDAIGAAAARHLAERGYRRFGYLGGPFLWAHRRLRGFERALSQTVSSFVMPEVRNMVTTLREVDAWLRDLPKPVGIFACSDVFASQGAHAALGLGLSIPEDVGIVGVDNDLALCCATETEQSSVSADPSRLGERAAQTLDDLIRGKAPAAHVLMLEPGPVITRRSTDAIAATSDPYVVRALRFIRDRACDGIDVKDVGRAAALSRSALQQRFRRLLGRSIHAEIARVRVERAKRLLADTDLPIARIADQVGISPQRYLNAVFKAHVGSTPARYRAGARAP